VEFQGGFLPKDADDVDWKAGYAVQLGSCVCAPVCLCVRRATGRFRVFFGLEVDDMEDVDTGSEAKLESYVTVSSTERLERQLVSKNEK
jgi:hypothetical protein